MKTSGEFISVNDARQAVLGAVTPGRVIKTKLARSRGYVLAKDIKSPLHSPSFHNSAMDGYAFLFDDFVNDRPVNIIGESSAGKNFAGKLRPGQAVRIFTGAAVPEGADTVVMQEKVSSKDHILEIHDKLIAKGANIRRAGSQIKKGAIAIEKGHLVSPATIGFLSSLGISEVSVYSKPVVAVIVTGNELVLPGNALSKGQIYESNSAPLKSALELEGIDKVFIRRAGDDFKKTSLAFESALASSDIVIFTGGISVGDYDFVGKVLKAHKVKQIFYKVRQKPGKPVFFGMKNKKPVFGLPGNPASVLTCFYEYVIPALRRFMNHPHPTLISHHATLLNTVKKKTGLTVFLKACTDFTSVRVLEGQESYIMKSFSEANCFVVLDEHVADVPAGSKVEVHYFGAV